MKNISRLLTAMAILLSFSTADAIVYSIDGLIDVNRMAVDKMYYDLYYNQKTRIFYRSDLVPLSSEAEQLIEKAEKMEIDRATSSNRAATADYSQQTGSEICLNDPYVGEGTEVNPEVQTLTKPSCLQGGANYAEDSIDYVYMVDKAMRAINAKEATESSFRTKTFNSPVPRVYWAPSSETSEYHDKWIIHDDGNLVWKDGVPVGTWVQGCQRSDGSPCYEIIRDNSPAPYRVDDAVWSDKAYSVHGMAPDIDLSMLTIKNVETTYNRNQQAKIEEKHYRFLFDNYTVTKGNVQFCYPAWYTSDVNDYFYVKGPPGYDGWSGEFCGGIVKCNVASCDSNKDVQYQCTYKCFVIAACAKYYNQFAIPTCKPITIGSISVSNQDVWVDIYTDGNDTSLEPPSPDTTKIYQAALQQLPEKATYAVTTNKSKPLKEIKKCDGTPSNPGVCH
jgi:hypothetical protein